MKKFDWRKLFPLTYNYGEFNAFLFYLDCILWISAIIFLVIIL